MPTPVVLVALLVVAAALLALKTMLGRKGKAYYLRKSLFTPAEQAFLRVLERELPRGVRVFGKVRLEDIFGVTKGFDRSEHQASRNRISRKHVDFLLVRSGDFVPLAGIELDDRSHEAEDRRQRDAFVDSAFASAGLPLLHVPVQKSYDPAELRAQVAAIIKT
jgi:hypothetical protein